VSNLSKSPHVPPKPADRLGEHTYDVCHEILGMSDEEIASLFGEGVLQTTGETLAFQGENKGGCYVCAVILF